VLQALTQVLKKIKSKERFVGVAGNGQEASVIFGAPAAVESYAVRFAIPLVSEDGAWDEDAFRAICITRIKQAAKRSA
jgi:hypothetical protein